MRIARPDRRDIVAGVSVAGLMLPEAIAYAGIAGLPAQHAVFAALAGALVYALVGRSRAAIVSPTSSSAAILAAVLATVGVAPLARIGLAAAITATIGLVFLLAAVARLGAVTSLISRPVLRGFAFGVGITIVVSQLPALVGVSLERAGPGPTLAAWLAAAPRWSLPSLAIGLASLAALLGLRRFPFLPGALLVLTGGVILSKALDLSALGVAMTPPLSLAPTWPVLPALSLAEWGRVGSYVAPLVLILFAESWGTIRTLALHRGDLVEPGRELGALGAANLASAAVQGLPVGAGFSIGSASEAAGAVSRWTAVVAAAAMAVLALVGKDLIAALPRPVLAAVVIAALTHALNPAPLVRLWRIRRDRIVALAAVAAVLAFGLSTGMVAAIVLSLAAMLQRLATPALSELGRLGGGHDYVDLDRHPDAVRPDGATIWRPAEPLFFGNAEPVLALIARRVRQAGRSSAVLSLEESFDLDSTALDALTEFDALMARSGVRLQLARVHDQVRDALVAGGATDLLSRSSYSVDDAVSAVVAQAPGGSDEA